jgi:hypothetical protein
VRRSRDKKSPTIEIAPVDGDLFDLAMTDIGIRGDAIFGLWRNSEQRENRLLNLPLDSLVEGLFSPRRAPG